MGVPPVLIHFRLGASLKSSLPALQTWIAGESSTTPRNTICVVIHTMVHIYIYIHILLLLLLLYIIYHIIIYVYIICMYVCISYVYIYIR